MTNNLWILWVLVIADGHWRAWETEYHSLAACLEVQRLITYHREDQITAVCRPKGA